MGRTTWESLPAVPPAAGTGQRGAEPPTGPASSRAHVLADVDRRARAGGARGAAALGRRWGQVYAALPSTPTAARSPRSTSLSAAGPGRRRRGGVARDRARTGGGLGDVEHGPAVPVRLVASRRGPAGQRPDSSGTPRGGAVGCRAWSRWSPRSVLSAPCSRPWSRRWTSRRRRGPGVGGALARHLVDHGHDGLVLNGTTGEAPTTHAPGEGGPDPRGGRGRRGPRDGRGRRRARTTRCTRCGWPSRPPRPGRTGCWSSPRTTRGRRRRASTRTRSRSPTRPTCR